ncbi:methanethiol S-methyltransferase [Rhizobium sp. NRK18]|uniref:methanethiol S-methyltransferase n=1 Tax=Rhizobium sp. NRK18 TaxID=2964667 RepID=UPI0021C27DA7|nr:methanethiol S-methyltransferase [Rhizobium sp. NRK18]MCQ2005533.1 isoprenylcysteine carboxylmethyltransferase family protein [Rhizobium sp. NRK18]
MKRIGFLAFGLVAYLFSLLTILYLIAFVAGLSVIPRSIDHPAIGLSSTHAVLVDLLLIAIFGLQHSLMARRSFKAAWTRLMPRAIERSGYLVFSCLAFLLLFTFWQPLPALLWDVRESLAEPLLWAAFLAGWLIALVSTFLIDHLELFGLAQVRDAWRERSTGAPRFRQPFLYRLVRHPLYSGFLVAFWATPAMSYGHLLFSTGMTAYVLVAIRLEERDLLSLFGAEYQAYRLRVGKLIPRFR